MGLELMVSYSQCDIKRIGVREIIISHYLDRVLKAKMYVDVE